MERLERLVCRGKDNVDGTTYDDDIGAKDIIRKLDYYFKYKIFPSENTLFPPRKFINRKNRDSIKKFYITLMERYVDEARNNKPLRDAMSYMRGSTTVIKKFMTSHCKHEKIRVVYVNARCGDEAAVRKMYCAHCGAVI